MSRRLNIYNVQCYSVLYDNAVRTMICEVCHFEMPVPSQGHYGFHIFPVVD